MFDAQIKVDLQQFNRSLTDIERKQLPYAIMLTLNETAKGGRRDCQEFCAVGRFHQLKNRSPKMTAN
ncbi:hypothetical protein GOE00_20720, partial [Sinorhizobium medicae]|nr:hypothetical protein [Sinorhizobium medicae]